MIRFCCERCGYKVGASDEKAGKRGKCPGCGGAIVVPEKGILVNFSCEDCGEKISALPTQAGKKGKCPKCRRTLVVPVAHNLTLLDVREESKTQDQPASRADPIEDAIERERVLEEESAAQKDESDTDSNLPWLIDIFLYPTSASGLTHLGIFTIVPLLAVIAGALLHPFRMGFGRGFGIVGLVATVAFFLYLCWFLAECVRDRANGGTRAPEAFATADLSEMWSQAQYIIGCGLIFVGPVGFYHLFTGRTDAVFWLLLTYGVFLLPRGLLSCVMFDSIRGLNPVLLVASILSAIVQYCGFVLLIGVVIVILKVVAGMDGDRTQREPISGLILGVIFYGFSLYAALIISHLLGRFYCRYQDKLNWEA